MNAKLSSPVWSCLVAATLFVACYPDFARLTSEAGLGGHGGGSGENVAGLGGKDSGGTESSRSGSDSAAGDASRAGTAPTAPTDAGAPDIGLSGAGGAAGEASVLPPACKPSAIPVGAAAILDYQFDEAKGTTAGDASRSKKNGTLTAAAWDPKGHSGSGIKLTGEGQRVTVPSGVVGGLDAVTIMAWVKLIAAPINSTLFDLGTDANNRFALQVSDGTSLRLIAKTATVDQTVSGTIALPTNRWYHVAVTLGGGKAAVYINGRPLARGEVTLKPSDLGPLAEVWIGQPHGAGSNTYGTVDEVQIFDRVVDEREIMQVVLKDADYTYFSFDELCADGLAVPAASPPGMVGALPAGASLAVGRLGKALEFNATSMQYVALPADVVENCTEDFTFASWVYLKTSNNWSRIFDFGADTRTFLYLTPSAQLGTIRFAAKLNADPQDMGAEQVLEKAGTLALVEWHHLAVVIKGNAGVLYYDGAEAGTNDKITINPSDLGKNANNWLGRSQYDVDPYLNGRLDDVVISCRAFTFDEIQLLAKLAPAPQ